MKIIIKNCFYLILLLLELSCSNTASKNKKEDTDTPSINIKKKQIKDRENSSKTPESLNKEISKHDTVLNGLKYGRDKNQTLDFYIPKSNNFSMVVMVHGGSWVWGNNKPLKDFSIKLNNQGYNVINVNYRLCSKTKAISLDSQLIDLKNAIEYAKFSFLKLQKRNIEKIYLLGVSAGGNLVLLALQENLINPDRVIAISPPTLLEDSVFLNNKIDKHLSFNSVVEQCFQINELRKFTIQKNKLIETGIPILLTHGKLDKIVPIQHSKYLVENSPQNSKIRLIEFPLEGHNYTNAKDSLLKRIIQFLRE
jgi:dipeptidyl aminopeptidase/acylaminoacyl peptidase